MSARLALCACLLLAACSDGGDYSWENVCTKTTLQIQEGWNVVEVDGLALSKPYKYALRRCIEEKRMCVQHTLGRNEITHESHCEAQSA